MDGLSVVSWCALQEITGRSNPPSCFPQNHPKLYIFRWKKLFLLPCILMDTMYPRFDSDSLKFCVQTFFLARRRPSLSPGAPFRLLSSSTTVRRFVLLPLRLIEIPLPQHRVRKDYGAVVLKRKTVRFTLSLEFVFTKLCSRSLLPSFCHSRVFGGMNVKNPWNDNTVEWITRRMKILSLGSRAKVECRYVSMLSTREEVN